MKILYFTLLILITTCNNLIGQDKDNKYIVSCYEISLSQYPQIVKLIQFENQNYQGFIITKLYEGKVNRKSAKEILDSAKINPEIVQTLMIKLKNEGIETIKDCKDDEQCKSIAFLDGGSVGFKISTESLKREYSFQEIYPYKTNNLEDTSLRKQAQKLLTTIDEALDLKTKFNIIINRLPRKFYYYFGNGNFFIQLKRR